ncbi:lysine transporter LysE [Rhodovulum adriaticum]|nr:lysine transporter LysE [Rhodovulum adriaticum]
MAAPGPALLYALRMSVAHGFTAGAATGAGLGLVAAAWTGAALLGLEAVFTLFPWAFAALKVGGAIYLLYIAVGLWRDARRPLGDSPHPERRAFWGGAAVNAANPKAVLFAASVLIVIFPPDLTLAQKGLIVGNHLVVELIVYALFAAALSTSAARNGYLAAKPHLDRLAAAVLGALGLKLILSR